MKPNFVRLLASVSVNDIYLHIQIKDTILLGTEAAVYQENKSTTIQRGGKVVLVHLGKDAA